MPGNPAEEGTDASAAVAKVRARKHLKVCWPAVRTRSQCCGVVVLYLCTWCVCVRVHGCVFQAGVAEPKELLDRL